MVGWEKVELHTIGDGKARAIFKEELSKVLENLLDSDRPHNDVRKINIEISFKCADEERRDIIYAIDAKTKLAPVKGSNGFIIVGSSDGEVTLFEDVDKQGHFR